MRLRLTVRRHNLPDAAIIWSVEAANDLTISQLLEQVNEIIPLESSGEWGLEDYAVEVTGSATNFECLHFQLVKSILHEDDEVIVRPLLTQDLKQRRLSGRHQITSDGRHLFDGFSFGRPRLRGAPDRPAITIPPRKRRRILYSAEDEESKIDEIIALGGLPEVVEHANGSRDLVIRTEFEDDDEDDDEEDDVDFEPSEEDDHEDMSEDGSENESQSNSTGEEEEDSEIDEDMNVERDDGAIRSLQTAFPEAPPSIIERILLSCGGNLNQAWVSLSHGFKPADGAAMGDMSKHVLSPRKTRSMRNKSTKRKRSSANEDEIEQSIGVDSGGSSGHDQEKLLLDYFDHHGLPDGSIISGKALSKMAEIANPNFKTSTSGQITSKKARSLSVTSNKSVRFAEDDSAPKTVNELDFADDQDEDDDDDDFSDDISSSTGSTDSSSESSEQATSEDESDSTSSTGSDSDSSSSDSDSQPEETSSKANGKVSGHLKEAGQKQNTISNNELADQKIVPPGEGTKSTKARNQRRRIASQLQRFKSRGILPAGTTLEEFKKLDKSALQTPEAALYSLTQLKSASKELEPTENDERAEADPAAFESKRAALLASLASGGVELTTTGRSHILEPSISDILATDSETADVVQSRTAPEICKVSQSHQPAEMDATGTVVVDFEHVVKDVSSIPVEQQSTMISEQNNEDSTPRRRIRLDLGAGRRLLFGALGIKTPKTKEDEEKIRSDLMKHRRPLKAVTTSEPLKDTNEEEILEDPDAWRQHIILRAVECCHEGVELSEPPFPFVQRWDPQQQGGYFDKGKRGGKGKKSQRNQPQYYDDEQENTKKRKRKNSQYEYHDTYEQSFFSESGANAAAFEDENGNYANSMDMQNSYSDAIEGEVSDQIMRDVNEAATSQPDDLPALPTDMSKLADLNHDNVTIGLTIAFKQLVMSKTSNWQPVISDYRTAVVIVKSENGSLELMLAKRDRIQSEKHYDEETGKRIYGKFDMPDDDEEEDDGYLAVTFSELIEPKIVQLPPEPFTNTATEDSRFETVDSLRGNSKTLSQEEPCGDVPKQSTDASAPDDEVGALDYIEGDMLSIRGGNLFIGNQGISTSSITTDSGNKTSIFVKETSFTSTSNREGLLSIKSDRVPGAGEAEVATSELTSVTSKNLDQKPSLSSIASQVTDHGRQPDFSTAGDDTLEQFADVDSFLHGDETSPVSEVQAPVTPEQDDLLDAGLSQSSWRNSLINDSSDTNLPSLDEVFSTARSSNELKSENILPPALSSIVEHDNSYNEAMAALDAQLEAAGDPDQPTPKASQRHSGSPFKIPAGSQQVDLTLSSDIEPASNAEKGSDGDYDGKYMAKRRRRGPRRKAGAASKESSQSLSQSQSQSQDSGRRSSRRKSGTKV